MEEKVAMFCLVQAKNPRVGSVFGHHRVGPSLPLLYLADGNRAETGHLGLSLAKGASTTSSFRRRKSGSFSIDSERAIGRCQSKNSPLFLRRKDDVVFLPWQR